MVILGAFFRATLARSRRLQMGGAMRGDLINLVANKFRAQNSGKLSPGTTLKLSFWTPEADIIHIFC